MKEKMRIVRKEWKNRRGFEKLLFFLFIWMFICISIYIFRGANLKFHSDSAAANLLAREQRISKQLIPDTWNYSTDLMIWFINIPISFLQLFIKSEFFMRSLSVFAFVIFAIASVWICMKSISGLEVGFMTCIWIFVCCSDVFRDMLIAEAAYIVPVINIFLCFYFWIESIDENYNIVKLKKFIILLVIVFMNGCFSIVIIQQVLFPFIGAIVLMTWYDSPNIKITEVNNIKKIIKLVVFLLIIAGISVLCSHVLKAEMGYKGNTDTMLMMNNLNDIVNKFPYFIKSILELLGIGGYGSLLSLYGIKNIFNLLLGIVIVACPVLLTLHLERENFQIRFFILFSQIHILEVLLILILGGGAGIARYMLTSACLMIAMSSYYISKYIIGKKSLNCITSIMVSTIMILFVFFNTYDKVSISLKGYEESYKNRYGIVDFLKENDLHYGYASFWYAGIYSVASDFEVEIFPVNFYEQIHPYYWLTSDRGFDEENYSGKTFLMMTQDEFDACLSKEGYCYPILGEPQEILIYYSYVIQTYDYNICMNDFSGSGICNVLNMMVFSDETMKQENGEVIIKTNQVLYGPYMTVPSGSYCLEVEAETIEGIELLVTEQGGKVMFRFPLENGKLEYKFVLEEEKQEVEFSIINTLKGEDIVIKSMNLIR